MARLSCVLIADCRPRQIHLKSHDCRRSDCSGTATGYACTFIVDDLCPGISAPDPLSGLAGGHRLGGASGDPQPVAQHANGPSAELAAGEAKVLQPGRYEVVLLIDNCEHTGHSKGNARML